MTEPVDRIETYHEVVDPVFASYVLPNATLDRIGAGFRWVEGPLWMGDWNALLFQDLPRDRSMAWREDGGLAVWRSPSWFANGQARDRQGRVVFCSHLRRCVARVDHDGSVTVLAERAEGKRLNAPNDVVVKSDGSIWFTDPLYGISNDYEGERQASEQSPAVYRLDPDSGDIVAVTRAFDGPNGLAFSPDEDRLYVAETGDQSRAAPTQVLRVATVARDGRLVSDFRDFHKVSPGYTDGLAVDEDGNVWSSAADGVHCIAPDGRLLGRLRVPARVSNLCFGGGPRLNRLFIAASHDVYAVFLNRRGARWPARAP